MKNLITGFVIVIITIITDINASEVEEGASVGEPFFSMLDNGFLPSESFEVVDLRTLTASPAEMMTAIKGAGKEGSYLYRLWAKIASMNPNEYKDLYDWRVATFFELVKQHFSDNTEISERLTGLGKENLDSKETGSETKSKGKNGKNLVYQESNFTITDKRFSKNPRVSSKNNVSPLVKRLSQEDVIEVCWEMLAKLFNSDYKNYCKVRLFLAHYRALQLEEMIHINESSRELRWLSFMTRLETIGLKDEHMIATGDLAYKTAYGSNAQATNETLDFLRKLIMSDYFMQYWLKKQRDALCQSYIWSVLIREMLSLSESFGQVSPSPFGAIGESPVVKNTMDNTCVEECDSNVSQSRLSPKAEPFTLLFKRGNNSNDACPAQPWGPSPAYNRQDSSAFPHGAPPPYQSRGK